MEKETAGEFTQERKLALAKSLAIFKNEDSVNEKLAEISIYDKENNVFKDGNDLFYRINTLNELKRAMKEKMLSYRKSRKNTEFLAEQANMTAEEYTDDFVENDQFRNNEITREHYKIDGFYIIGIQKQ